MSKDDLKEYCEIREKYVQSLRNNLLGPGSEGFMPDDPNGEHEVIASSASGRYFFGLIYPKALDSQIADTGSETDSDDDTDLDLENLEEESANNNFTQADSSSEGMKLDFKSGENPYDKNDDPDDSVQRANTKLPSSAGFTFFSDIDADSLKLSVSFATYKRCDIEDCKSKVSSDLDTNQAAKDIIQESGIFTYDNKNNLLCLKDVYTGTKEEKVKKLREQLKKLSAKDGVVGKLPSSSEVKKLLYNPLNNLSQKLWEGHKRYPHSKDVKISFIKLNDKDKDFKESEYIDDEKVKVSIIKRKIEIDGGTRAVYSYTVMLVNDSSDEKDVIFQPKIRIESAENKINFIDYSKTQDLSLLTEEEVNLALLYRDKKVYGTGHGTAVKWNVNEAGEGYLETDFFPENEVPQMTFELTGDYELNDEKVLQMKFLSDLDKTSKDGKIEALENFVSMYKKWIGNQKENVQLINSEVLKKEAEKNLKLCEESYNRIINGIAKLKTDNTSWLAFELANRAMFMQRVHVKDNNSLKEQGFDRHDNMEMDYSKIPSDNLKWRPFQLAFLLMSVVSITEDNNPERDLVDLIWFPTGGGKTEAYLGLTALTIFYRRLAYPTEANGTTVIMRYTLRLLTADQFNRAATLICACELIRKERSDLGNERITVGLWVGSSATPNKLSDAATYIQGLKDATNEYSVNENSKFQVIKCPWCGESLLPKEDGNNHYNGISGYKILRKSNNKPRTMIIHCVNTNCKFSDDQTENNCLPVSVVDEVIYKKPPTLLFGTVDKFAMLPWKEEPGKFFGVGTKNRAPELIIQDELHLISGALGSIVGLYETAIDYLCQKQKPGVKPKIIASTATIRRAHEQCKALYNRDVRQFPSPGILSSDSFFAKEGLIDHENGIYGRLYVGMMSPKTKDTTESRVIANLLNNSFMLEENDKKDSFWTLLCYYNTTRELGTGRSLIDGSASQELDSLSYINGGKSRGDINYEELTGQTKASDLVKTFDALGKCALDNQGKRIKDEDVILPPDVALATNMISVGVDISRLNVMLMIGQPKLTSEYIQASSRVGRNTPGVVFTLYNSVRSRDRSHFEQFNQYHDSFYKYVEPTGVTPFAETARERALHAVVTTMLRNSSDTIRSEKSAGNIIDNMIVPTDIQNAINDILSFIKNRANSTKARNMKSEADVIEKEITDFIENYWKERSITQTLSYGNEYMVTLPAAGQNRLLRSFEQVATDDSKRTMTSMRSVDKQVGAYILINGVN